MRRGDSSEWEIRELFALEIKQEKSIWFRANPGRTRAKLSRCFHCPYKESWELSRQVGCFLFVLFPQIDLMWNALAEDSRTHWSTPALLCHKAKGTQYLHARKWSIINSGVNDPTNCRFFRGMSTYHTYHSVFMGIRDLEWSCLPRRVNKLKQRINLTLVQSDGENHPETSHHLPDVHLFRAEQRSVILPGSLVWYPE